SPGPPPNWPRSSSPSRVPWPASPPARRTPSPSPVGAARATTWATTSPTSRPSSAASGSSRTAGRASSYPVRVDFDTRVGCYAWIERDGHVLLPHWRERDAGGRDHAGWTLPGGGMEHGETPEA